MKSIVDVGLTESYLSLPKLETKNQIVFKKNTLQKRISMIRESQDNINKLEQLSQEYFKDADRGEVAFSFIQLPSHLNGFNTQNFFSHKEEHGKHYDNPLQLPATTTHNAYQQQHQSNYGIHSNQATSHHKKSLIIPTRFNPLNEYEDQRGGTNKKSDSNMDFQQSDKVKKIKYSNSLQPNKFKKISIPKPQIISHNAEEEIFIKDHWNEQQKYELQTGETLNFLFKNLADNLQNLVNFKSEKYCIKIIEKYVNYNRKLKRLIDITNTPFKDYNATLLLSRYFKILYKSLHATQVKQQHIHSSLNSPAPSPHFYPPIVGNEPSANTIQNVANSNTFTNNSNINTQLLKKEEPLTPVVVVGESKSKERQIPQLVIVHDKSFLDNILDLNSRLEEWVMGMQKTQIQQFSTQLVDITEQVFEKELTYKNQLINHQKKQSYLELKNLIKNKYSLNLRAMKSKLSQQIRSCEEKNGDIKFVHKQIINRGDCIDRVIACIENLDLY